MKFGLKVYLNCSITEKLLAYLGMIISYANY
jgi:hypothetical protein